MEHPPDVRKAAPRRFVATKAYWAGVMTMLMLAGAYAAVTGWITSRASIGARANTVTGQLPQRLGKL